MNSLILQTGTRIMRPLLILFAVFLLIHGHNEPGGGFTGGLMAAAAYSLHAVAFGVISARNALRLAPQRLIGLGLLTALASGLFAVARGEVFMSGQWTTLPLPLLGKLKVGTPLLFDVGVFMVVVGIVLMIIFALMEEDHGV
jgi:multicomponent Na+:H+ antiporter subunit B